MRNPAPYIRRQLFDLLNGNVSFESSNIPVYEGQGKIHDNYVIIGGYSDTDVSDKHTRKMDAVQDIEIVTIKNDTSSRASDEIAEIVMNLIHPTIDSDLWSVAEFQVWVVGGPSMLPIREDSMSGKNVARRVLRYNLLMEEL